MKKKAYISIQPNNKIVIDMSEHIDTWTPTHGYYHVGFQAGHMIAHYAFAYLQKNIEVKYIFLRNKIQKSAYICMPIFEDRKKCVLRKYESVFPEDALYAFTKEVAELLNAPLLENNNFFAFQAINRFFSYGPAIKRVRNECKWYIRDRWGFYYPNGSC